jgi:hypothetical protein
VTPGITLPRGAALTVDANAPKMVAAASATPQRIFFALINLITPVF